VAREIFTIDVFEIGMAVFHTYHLFVVLIISNPDEKINPF
jgi:hypothetical protein